mmetsp:Transcript_9915/g.19845  ORF Transcript_9915/g.19845 Transcript_9915/m.19845 type:complete len:204 (+) Transcript_9915:128-739(+)
MIRAMYPLSKDSTSMSALSLSTTITMSPASTLSPSPFIHCTILPSFIVDDSAGIVTGVEGGPEGAASAAGAAAGAAAAAAGAGASPPLPMSSLLATMTATVEPTSAASPSSTRICERYPSSNASTSMSALSDSTTITMSPASILSPTCFVHWTILPSFIVDDKAGMATLVASTMRIPERADAWQDPRRWICWRGFAPVANTAF